MKNQSITNVWFLVLAGMIVLAGTCPVAFGVITSNRDLPSDRGVYVSQQQGGPKYEGADLLITTMDPVFDPLAETAVRTQVGADELEVFDSIFTADLSIYISGSYFAGGLTELTGPANMMTYDKWDVTTGMFGAEIVSMELSGQVDGLDLWIHESPTLASNGQTLITDLGGGLYDIESFFDVFTELSVDGGGTWIPSTGSMRMDLVIPEPATIAILGLGAFLMSRKRRF